MLPPPALRRYLGFAKLSPTALAAIARVVDHDDDFRARVAASVDADAIGRGGWLWLARPAGWADELAAIEDEDTAREAARSAEQRAARDERSAARRLAATEAALTRAERLAEQRRTDVKRLQDELSAARAAGRAAEERATELESSVADLTDARAEAVRNLKETEARLAQRGAEVNALKARVRELEARTADANSARPGGPAGPAGGERGAAGGNAGPTAGGGGTGGVVAGGGGAGGVVAGGGDAVIAGKARIVEGKSGAGGVVAGGGGAGGAAAGPVAADVDVGAVARELGRAAAGAAALAEGLAALATSLGVSGGTRTAAGAPGPPTSPTSPAPPPSRSSSGPIKRDAAGPPPARRAPVALPGGLLDDSVAAAEHLLRTPGAILVVDGYNVTMSGWPELTASDQRRRLVAALVGLAARMSTPVELVFDGAEVDRSGTSAALAVPAPARQLVRVRFSPPGIEADDVVLDLVEQLPPSRPVIVVSSDNRVREGARRRGANVLYARQLLDALGVGGA